MKFILGDVRMGKPDIEKMRNKGDVKGLMKALKHESSEIRDPAAEALKEMGWEPSNDNERAHYAYYLSMAHRWDELVPLGKPAIEPLVALLKHHRDPGLLLPVINALGMIGDTDAIDPLGGSTICTEAALQDQFDWDYYKAVLPAAAQALSGIGKSDIQQITKRLKKYERMLMGGMPFIWALCEIGDRRATEAVVNWIFSVGPSAPIVPGSFGTPLIYEGQFLSPSNLIRECVPRKAITRLLVDYTDLILDIFAWELTASETGDQLAFDTSTCVQAVERLCSIKTTVSSNILHKVLEIKELDVGLQYSTVETTTSSLDFAKNQAMAMEELSSRGKPGYDPAVYLVEDAMRI